MCVNINSWCRTSWQMYTMLQNETGQNMLIKWLAMAVSLSTTTPNLTVGLDALNLPLQWDLQW